jgi:iron complex outermembrane receptor protein
VRRSVKSGVQYGTVQVTDGSQNFVDVNGDGQLVVGQNNALDENVDFDVLGSGIPDLELGWSNQLTLGKYTVNAFFRGAFGHSLVNTFRAFYEPRVGSQKSYNYINTELANDAIKNANFSSLYVEKADFFKLDNLNSFTSYY